MLEEDYGLQADPLFTGLTRPPMALGVHYLFFVVNALGTMLVFINTKNFAAVGIFIPLHIIAYLVCLKEPRAIELTKTRYGSFSRCKNRLYHGFTNSYDL